MTMLQLAVGGLTVVGLLVWLANLLLVAESVRRVPQLRALRAPAPACWPRVSIVVPACNEVRTLEAALQSHLASDYPDLEILLVDDRSTDGTAALVDRIAAADPRVHAIHVTTLPAGWLGKVHALHTGAAAATGDWLLFADADGHVRPDTLRHLVAWCERDDIDCASPIVRLLGRGHLLVDAVVSTFARVVFVASQPWKSADPDAKQAFGIGAFMLVRRSAFAQTEGFPWLRLEVADDMALALLLKRAGARLGVVNARDDIALALYTTPEEMRRSTEKGGYAILGHYSLARTLALAGMLSVLELAPFAGFIPVGLPWLPALGVAGLALMLAAQLSAMHWLGRPRWTALTAPLGVVWMSWLNARSGVLGAIRRGIRWRDTFYPSALLRTGIRVHWP